MTRKVRLVAVVKEEEVEKLRAVAEETSFERLMVKKNMKRVKMTMKMRVNLRVMRVKTQSLKVKIQVVRSTISIR